MSFHKHLQKQINKYLDPEIITDERFKKFINAVNDSYLSYERDRELMSHAFIESEKEFVEVNENLKKEYDLKEKSIANLFESISKFNNEFEAIPTNDKKDLLFVSNYLKEQISKRKEVATTLLRTIELLKKLFANLQSGILVEDEDGKILFCNDLFCEIFEKSVKADDLVGKYCDDFREKAVFKDFESFEIRTKEIVSKREIVTNELLQTVDGRYFERDFIPVFIKNVYKGHLWKYTDVSKRMLTKNLLEQSEERNRLIMNSALNAIITIDSLGNITFWNDQAEKIFGWHREEVLGKKLSETIIPQVHKASHNHGIDRFLLTGKTTVLNKQMELSAVNKNNQEFPIEISIIPVIQNGETFFCSFIQDISVRKKAEQKLKYQEEKYRNIIANMNLGLLEVDVEENIVFTNQSFCDISGFDYHELIGKRPSDLFSLKENEALIEEKKDLRTKGVSDIYRIPIINKNGEQRWWAISGAPNFDDKGNLIGSIGIHLDITDQKQLEIDLEAQKTKAEEASKAKEAFLANMSHEIRTPLNAIIGFLRELKKQELNDFQRKHVENSTVASKHLLAIINNILDISKIEAGEMSLEEVDFSIENTLHKVVTVLLPKAEEKGLILEANISKSVFKVFKGDALRIEQVLFNLVGNSLKFTKKGSINLTCKLLENHPDKQKIEIAVADTGIGMDKKYIDSIFKKFSQEDKEVTRKFGGTGLGMSISKELVQLMKGHINIESEKEIGTIVRIVFEFPKGDVNKLLEAKTEQIEINLDGVSILLVEDNEMNRMVAQNSLQYFKCDVTEAVNGLQAIEMLKKKSFDIILMDIQMPELDGIEATKIIRNELHLNTPIIALSANAFKTEIEKCKNAGMTDYISKPFEEHVLYEIVSKYAAKKRVVHDTPKEVIMPLQLSSQKVYNLSAIEKMSRGNQDFVLKMIKLFIEQSKITIQKIRQAIEQDDFEEVSRLIHKIKPSIEGLGILSILDKVKLLEKIALESTDKVLISALFDEIQIVLEKAAVELYENEVNK
ncbi:hypothetical protein B0A58_06150 [Flavobacterium branchiophilum NBRC 15030 = ATCC 35035]|uniref:histidine kinase n=1 Tax=Flavobacterium branchiophilum TaxID=55197 RepID=A0A543G0D9_9FLAO|nr:PAS domain S-box protein [Flavobacterium branchiophilum]OXA76991.1 hypothetical protein B0A58_06150 [Flavobacterium branchiophilum NBRC 15030 = ATCC 35035]TQM39550.1 PAS domain S-box-containing protein [Flavobacterium branchiophilum]GEM54077.1 hypothetical protein FB1_02980 [Flavobacterium branchiophilum NBRC 15030 = ATCC 35035]